MHRRRESEVKMTAVFSRLLSLPQHSTGRKRCDSPSAQRKDEMSLL